MSSLFHLQQSCLFHAIRHHNQSVHVEDQFAVRSMYSSNPSAACSHVHYSQLNHVITSQTPPTTAQILMLWRALFCRRLSYSAIPPLQQCHLPQVAETLSVVFAALQGVWTQPRMASCPGRNRPSYLPACIHVQPLL